MRKKGRVEGGGGGVGGGGGGLIIFLYFFPFLTIIRTSHLKFQGHFSCFNNKITFFNPRPSISIKTLLSSW